MTFMRSTGPPAGEIPRSAGRLREIEALLHPAARGEEGGMGAELGGGQPSGSRRDDNQQ
jgi:hypothetical protein